MFAQAATSTLDILLFRSGPEDFPFDPSKRLTLGCIVFGVAANAAFFGVLGAPVPLALALAAFNLWLLWLFVSISFRTRGIENRIQQSFNALVTTTSVLALAMTPVIAKLFPFMLKLSKQIEADPTLAASPELMAEFPQAAFGLFMLLGLWQLVVSCRIIFLAAGPRVATVFVALFLLIAILPKMG